MRTGTDSRLTIDDELVQLHSQHGGLRRQFENLDFFEGTSLMDRKEVHTVTPWPRHVSQVYLRPDFVHDPVHVLHLMLRDNDSFLHSAFERVSLGIAYHTQPSRHTYNGPAT